MYESLQAELPDATVQESDDACRIDVWINQFVAEWEADHTLTAAAFGGRYAEIAGDTWLLAILGYEELLLRQAAGESVDEDAFSVQMCGSKEDFDDILAIHDFVTDHPSVLPGLPALPELGVKVSASLRTVWPTLGETLAGFKFLELLGRGGFARVFLAEELALGRRRVAVKVSSRGAKEAHFLGKLRHPNIVPVFSIQLEPERNLTLICMPFLGRVTLGDALGELFRNGRRPRRANDLVVAITQAARRLEGAAAHPMAAVAVADDLPSATSIDPRLTRGSYVDAVVYLAEQLAEALVYTNREGIYHRDLKPTNVLLDARGAPMLLDFNVSFDKRAASQQWGGTVRYMAPELVKVVAELTDTVPVDPRSDLFSLAVMLYELLSGEHPFGHRPGDQRVTAEAAFELYNRQQTCPRRLCERNPDVEPALSALIARCLSFNIDDRPRDADEMLHALRRLAGRRGQLRRWAWRHRGAVLAATCLLSAAAAVGGYAVAALPPHVARQYRAAESARQSGDYTGALARLDDAESEGFDPGRIARLRSEVHYQLASQAFLGGDFLIARDHCTKAIDSGESAWQAHLLRARVHTQLRDFHAALEDANRVERLHMVSDVHAVRGDCYCAAYKWNLAAEAYYRALVEGVKSATIYNNLAYSLAKLNHRERAIDFLHAAISLDGDLGDAYYQRASVAAALAADQDQPVPEQAATDIETAIKLLPANYRVYLTGANVFAALAAQTGSGEQWQKAASYLLESLRLGLKLNESPASGPLVPLLQKVRASQDYEAAVKTGASAARARLPGLVDSLAAFD